MSTNHTCVLMGKVDRMFRWCRVSSTEWLGLSGPGKNADMQRTLLFQHFSILNVPSFHLIVVIIQARKLAEFRPNLNTIHLLANLQRVQETVEEALQVFNSTRLMLVYYEDVLQNRTVSRWVVGWVGGWVE